LVEIQVVRTKQGLEEYRDRWDQLLKASSSNSLFLSWNWVYNWVDNYLNSDELFCLIVHKDGKLAAIAPFWIARVRVFGIFRARILRFVGTTEICPDHLDIIVRRKNSRVLIEAVWDSLFGAHGKEWDIFEYYAVPGESLIFNHFYRLSDEDDRCLDFQIEGINICPYVRLPKDWEDYLASLTSRNRWNVRRSLQVLSESGTLKYERCEAPDQFDLMMESMMELHGMSWDRESGPTGFRRDRFRRFHTETAKHLLDKGQLSLVNLRLDDELIGAMYGFEYAKVAYGYVLAVDREKVQSAGVGRVMFAHYIEDLIGRGFEEFDMLRGDEEYKYYWTDTDRKDYRVNIYSRKFVSFLRIKTLFLKFYLKEFARSLFGSRLKNIRKTMMS